MANNPIRDLAVFFIKQILGRSVTPADFRGRHMKASSKLLKEMGYQPGDVRAALEALHARRFTDFGYDSERQLPGKLEGMEILYAWGEPPLIERFLATPPPPEIYSNDYDRWVEQYGARAIERGEWDGIYLHKYPGEPDVMDWLEPIIGIVNLGLSIIKWAELQPTTQQKKQSSGT
jgi:hypothetical protein